MGSEMNVNGSIWKGVSVLFYLFYHHKGEYMQRYMTEKGAPLNNRIRIGLKGL